MKNGKHICETLKSIRRDIAQANEIDYNPEPCTHEGDCKGTCPRCESEVRRLERQLRLRQSLGKAVTIAGLTIAAGTLATACNQHKSDPGVVLLGVIEPTGEDDDNSQQNKENPTVVDSIVFGKPDSLAPEVYVPADSDLNK